MPTDGEVEHVQRFDHAAIRPHVRPDATTTFGGCLTEYVMRALRLRIVWVDLGDRRR